MNETTHKDQSMSSDDVDEERLLYFEAHQINARALFLGSRIDVWEFERADTLSINPLTIQAGHTGYAVLLRFGMVVLIGLSALEEAAFLRTLAPFVSNRFEHPESEEADIVIDPSKPERINPSGAIVLHEASQERLQVVATALAKSVVLAVGIDSHVDFGAKSSSASPEGLGFWIPPFAPAACRWARTTVVSTR
jgi:uncharacterized Rmd1/YagE family protein